MVGLFGAAGICYLLAAVGHFLWATERLKNTRLGKTFLLIAFFLHTAELWRAGVSSGMFPLYNVRNALIFFSWCIMLLYGANLIRHRFEMLSFFTVLLVIFFILPTALIPNPPPLVDRPALRDWVTSMHIGLSIFSYATFCLAALAACGFLVEHGRLKGKNKMAVLLKLPPLEILETIQIKMVNCGLSTLGLGILFGFCWAFREEWSVLAEPKILMTGFVFLMYLAFAVARARFGISSRRFSGGLVAGFLVCLVSFFVMNYFFHGKHHF